MAFGSFSEGGNAQPMAEINTTPLVDVMLVLLIIFIITAPLLNQAVPVDLPRAQASPVQEAPRIVHLALDGANRTFLEGQLVPAEALESRLQAVATPEAELHLRADRQSRYEQLAQVMAAAQKAGLSRIAFVTEAPAAP